MDMEQFEGVKVFSATKHKDRAELGERVTEWMRANKVDVVERKVLQSSDHEYHCISIVLFYRGVSACPT